MLMKLVEFNTVQKIHKTSELSQTVKTFISQKQQMQKNLNCSLTFSRGCVLYLTPDSVCMMLLVFQVKNKSLISKFPLSTEMH